METFKRIIGLYEKGRITHSEALTLMEKQINKLREEEKKWLIELTNME